MENKNPIAVFIDFENMALCKRDTGGFFDMWKTIEASSRFGMVAIKRAYGDWRHYDPAKYKLYSNNIDLIQVYARGRMLKNGADIRMSVDAMEVLFKCPHIDTFVIVGSDSDYTGLVLKLREYGKYVIGIGARGAVSEHFKKSVNEYLYYAALIGGESQKKITRHIDINTVKDIIYNKLDELAPSQPLQASALKYELLRRDPAFSERNFGFSSFIKFLRSISDVVKVTHEGSVAFVKLAKNDTPQSSGDTITSFRKVLKKTFNLQLVSEETLDETLELLDTCFRENRNYSRADLKEVMLDYALDQDSRLESEDINKVLQMLWKSEVFFTNTHNKQTNLLLRSNLNSKRSMLDQINRSIASRIYSYAIKNSLTVDRDALQKLLYKSPDQSNPPTDALLNEAQREAQALQGKINN